ncbi:hypothetical protein [Kluyvera georgiana]|uniref:hypothetical protein n=1 Tax=Kluyvera georgiana TaxID=73098 RepID=UPI0013DC5F96|nr:hypothetical protein [Kluyvera georgiana]
MAELEEIRPIEGMRVPIQVRCKLRKIFSRWLSQPYHPSPVAGADEMVDELSLLNLNQYYRLEYIGGLADIANIWNESEDRIADGGPTFEDLIHLGWVFFDGGRWIMQASPLGTLSHITYPSPSTEIFLTSLSKLRLVAKVEEPPQDAQTLAARILDECWLERYIPTTNPDWLIGRLWERLCPKPQPQATVYGGSTILRGVTPVQNEVKDSSDLFGADVNAIDRAFLEWSAWCNVLGSTNSWDSGWRAVEMRYCHEAAHRVLERQALWNSWDNDIANYIGILEKTFTIPRNQLHFARMPKMAPPRTLVAKGEWIARADIENIMIERVMEEQASTVSFAFSLLCSELEKTDIGPDLTSSADTLLSFAVKYPLALQHLLFRINSVPMTCPQD